MALDPRRVKALFNAALDLPDPAERTAFVDRECRDDPELRRRLEELLAAYDRPASALERPLVAEPGETSAPDEPPAVTGEGPAPAPGETAGFRLNEPPTDSLIGTIIAGRYKLRQEIGEGVMGSVFLTEQTRPVRRQVALKLIKPGMDSRTVLARFESERQALALMDHPNIARVLDAGATDSGRPFFVMELVKGIPLTDYCDQHRLGLPERLTLFRQICLAVQHAHQKGIIHRDLKPSNILVESHDGHPVPKVIDFGLAKATSGLQLSEHTLFTAFGTVAGTPLYMAPEQASFNALDIDTRADIYALGVILYELLTGSTPIQKETFKQAALDEILRVIREVEPPTPSSRISTSEALASIAATRKVEPMRLGRFVRGDLDWIVMKALAKERQRRYESAIALAQDIERFTNHEPVSAGSPTAGYRLRKFVRRNRPQVLAAALVLLALVAGIVGTTVGLLEARRQERFAVAESREKEKARQAEALQRRNAEEQRRNAEAQRQQAEKRLTQIEKANEILGSIFKDLNKDLNPYEPEDADKPLAVLLRERLDQAAAMIEGESIGDPVAVARMQTTLGVSQRVLHFPEKAIALLSKARATLTAQLGPDHADTLRSMANLAFAYLEAGKSDRALPLFEETLALRKAKLGPDHNDTISSMQNLASGFTSVGKPDRALALWEDIFALVKAKLGPDHLHTIDCMNNLGIACQVAGKLDRALAVHEETLALRKAKLGLDDPRTFQSMNNVALCFASAGKFDRALPLYEEALAGRKSKLGRDHPKTLLTMNNLARCYLRVGKLDRALALYEEELAVWKSKLGADSPITLAKTGGLANVYSSVGKFDRAVPLHEDTLALTKAKLGPDDPATLQSMGDLALAYREAGQPDRALPLHKETYEKMKVKFGSDHPRTLTSMHNLARGYEALRQFDRAVPLFEETVTLAKSKLGIDDATTTLWMNQLADCYRLAGKLDRAQSLLHELADIWKGKAGANWEQYFGVLVSLSSTLLHQEKWTEAETVLRELLTLGETKEPDDWRTFNTRSMLGGALLGQKKYADAEPLLRAGYEGMKLRAEKIPPRGKARLAEALDRLIALAEATNRPEDARKWKDERRKLSLAPASKPEAEDP
jgi:serine/threonine protein kinase